MVTKKFKVGYYFETEIEVRAEEGDHVRIIDGGSGATLDFHAGDIGNEPDEEGLVNWDAPYHPEFRSVREESAIVVQVMGAFVIIHMNDGEKYIPEIYHKQIANELMEETYDGELIDEEFDIVGDWELKYKE